MSLRTCVYLYNYTLLCYDVIWAARSRWGKDRGRKKDIVVSKKASPRAY